MLNNFRILVNKCKINYEALASLKGNNSSSVLFHYRNDSIMTFEALVSKWNNCIFSYQMFKWTLREKLGKQIINIFYQLRGHDYKYSSFAPNTAIKALEKVFRKNSSLWKKFVPNILSCSQKHIEQKAPRKSPHEQFSINQLCSQNRFYYKFTQLWSTSVANCYFSCFL